MKKPRVLILADDCNPDWPSLPVVGYKYGLSLAKFCDVTIATHLRNRENIEKDPRSKGVDFRYVDNEYVARPIHRFSTWIRGGGKVAWSLAMIFKYPAYLTFEWEVWKTFKNALISGEYDLVHRITPMSPTMPSYIAGKSPVPFVIGPLNGNLDWPKEFRSEQSREKERARALRDFYKYLPYSSATYKNAKLILAAFDHTARDLPESASSKVVSFPEVGFDPEWFNTTDRKPAFAGDTPYNFAFVGRLVPYKVPEVAIRAFCESDILARHKLHIVGEGPERDRLEEIVRQTGRTDSVVFHGWIDQKDVGQFFKTVDGFVFPSIRELGAGVVVEAMASGCVNFVTNYGAPGDLVSADRGFRIELNNLDTMVAGYRQAMEEAVTNPGNQHLKAKTAEEYASACLTWNRKAALTVLYYDDIIAGRPVTDRRDYT
ncbi:glycosyltransferase family 4 protein [Labrenzia sp. PHM005]|uniref:glycosyltransferase family 4 protein n=1 Tax=Labrenzia sp. PHM005 TaxID=2590016 RepID=UPI00114034A3|nr:glycosyltransferase [Labrenzia sp. PHM005]QDG74823.1 glycosyltransferase [Labrenzia sp. PHM005]